jgi:3-oxoacyl-[acyl-carrier-protein] synthase II
MPRRRVAITGLGVLTPFGYGVDAFWEGLLEGRCAIGPIRSFDAGGLRCQIAGEVPADAFSVRKHVPKSYRKATKVMARDSELAVGAAEAAVRDAGIITRGTAEDGEAPTYAPSRLGCQIGAGLLAPDVDELARALVSAKGDDGSFSFERFGETGMFNLPPLWLLKYLPNMLACHVTIIHDARGPSNTITCYEASGLLSIGASRAAVERGDADACFAGGAESKINLVGLMRSDFGGYVGEMDASTPGAEAVRPYDPDAPGGVLGEAGGIVTLEELESAESRGARVYAEVVGFGGGHSTLRGDLGARSMGLQRAIGQALRDASISPDEIDAIVPSAVGSWAKDEVELAALRGVFGDRLAEVPLITLTPMLGHSLAGMGGVAVSAASLALRHQTLPARLHAGSPASGARAEPAPSGDARLAHALVCTGALGGQNAAVVLRRA